MGSKANAVKVKGTEREAIIEALNLIDNNTINPPMSRILFLLGEYNKAYEYTYYKEEDLYCGECRRQVVNFWRNIRKEWKKEV